MFSLLGSCVAALALHGLMALLHGTWKMTMNCMGKKPEPKMKEAPSNLSSVLLGEETFSSLGAAGSDAAGPS